MFDGDDIMVCYGVKAKSCTGFILLKKSIAYSTTKYLTFGSLYTLAAISIFKGSSRIYSVSLSWPTSNTSVCMWINKGSGHHWHHIIGIMHDDVEASGPRPKQSATFTITQRRFPGFERYKKPRQEKAMNMSQMY